MNTCATCKHWGGWNDADASPCKIIQWDDNADGTVPAEVHVSTELVSLVIDAMLLTKPTFGCNLWERSE
jgi:hypothetical protein